MLWLLIIAPLALGYGFYQGAVFLRKGRRPHKVDLSLLSWEETPRSIFWQDSLVGLLILIHSVSLLLLAVSGLRVSLIAWEAPLPDPVQRLRWLFFGAVTLVVLHTWLAAGMALSYPVLTSRIGPVQIHLLPEGILHGRVRIPWTKIGSVVRVPASRGILLRSRRNPEITLLSLMPPTNELFTQALSLIGTHLSELPAGQKLPVLERKSTFVILFMATVIPVLIIGMILVLSPGPWSFIYYTIATYLATFSGSKVLLYYFS